MLLIFDCDGVVVDSMLLHTEVESEAYGSIGIAVSPKDLAMRFSGVSDAEVHRVLSEETGRAIPAGIAERIERRKKEVFAERLKPMAGIREVLTALDEKPRCLASGTGVDLLYFLLGIVGLTEQFAPHIYSSEMTSRGKPFPDLFLHAANQLGYAPKNSLVIEDGVPGVQAGRAAGMRVLGFTGGEHCDEAHAGRLMAAGAELVFSDMRELPGLVRRFDAMLAH
jgi:HAD superfamily hydrolase (TIGR01509 family)